MFFNCRVLSLMNNNHTKIFPIQLAFPHDVIFEIIKHTNLKLYIHWSKSGHQICLLNILLILITCPIAFLIFKIKIFYITDTNQQILLPQQLGTPVCKVAMKQACNLPWQLLDQSPLQLMPV
jgi:hypothetical protein